jgi:hypothetical protein
MEHDERENTDESARRERVDQKDGCRYDPDHPEHHAHPTKALAEGRGPEHGHPEGNESYGHQEEPYAEQRIEDTLGRLPHEDECRPILRRRPGSMVEVGDRGGSDVRKSSGCEHAETHNARTLPKSAGARLVTRRARYKARKWATHKMRTTR